MIKFGDKLVPKTSKKKGQIRGKKQDSNKFWNKNRPLKAGSW